MENKILPAYNDHNIPIVFSTDDKFVPVMAIMIQSIIENSTKSNNYDILILTRYINKDYVDLLEKMVAPYDNFSLRIINIQEEVSKYNFYTANRATITAETYFRLFIPDLMPEYSKIVYLDGDMIANADIAELYNVDLEGYFLASTRDCDGIGHYYIPGDARKDYRDNVLKLKNPDNYFCAGMLVMNLDLFRAELPSSKLLEFATSYNYQWHDQDVLNVLCEGKVKLLNMAWDVLRDAGNNQYMPSELYEEFLESECNPKIIHYGGARKPWIYFDVERGEYFWKYVGNTPFYKQILSMVSDTYEKRYDVLKRSNVAAVNLTAQSAIDVFKSGKAGFGALVKCFNGWLSKKIKK